MTVEFGIFSDDVTDALFVIHNKKFCHCSLLSGPGRACSYMICLHYSIKM